MAELPVLGVDDAFSLIVKGFDDDSPQVRNAAARALRKLEPQGIVELFARALKEGSPERRQNIGAALAESGMTTEAINDLASENREDTYNALCLLFVMAKAGQIEPLQKAIEDHPDDEVCRSAIKLFNLVGHTELAARALKRRKDRGQSGNQAAAATL